MTEVPRESQLGNDDPLGTVAKILTESSDVVERILREPTRAEAERARVLGVEKNS